MNRPFGHLRCTAFVWALAFLYPLSLASQTVAIKAKKIYTVTQGVIEKGVLLVENGKILEIGPEGKVPWNSEVLDYSQKIIVPGLVEAHAARGYDIPNETNPLTPFVTVMDSLDLSHDALKLALRSGVTTMNIMPGNATILGGRGAVIKPYGLIIGDALMMPDSGMKISVVGTLAQSRMGVMAQLRRYFDETKDYVEKREKKSTIGKKDEMVSTPMAFRSPEYVKYEAVADLLGGRYQAFIYCATASDVLQAEKLSEVYGLKCVYVLGPQAYKAASFAAEKKLKVILDPELIYFEKDPVTEEIRKIEVGKVFQEAGLEFAIQSDPEKVQARTLFYQAMKLMSCGISAEIALKSITLVPARILGVDGLIGSLEKGKLANFVVLDKEPFDFSGKIEMVYIEGKPAYDRAKDEDLKDLSNDKIGE